jgi:hypothetical protein
MSLKFPRPCELDSERLVQLDPAVHGLPGGHSVLLADGTERFPLDQLAADDRTRRGFVAAGPAYARTHVDTSEGARNVSRAPSCADCASARAARRAANFFCLAAKSATRRWVSATLRAIQTASLNALMPRFWMPRAVPIATIAAHAAESARVAVFLSTIATNLGSGAEVALSAIE